MKNIKMLDIEKMLRAKTESLRILYATSKDYRLLTQRFNYIKGTKRGIEASLVLT